MAVRILSLTSSSSVCERNWSTFENIYTKKRNRLTTERLNSLVFIQFNSRMMAKKQMIKEKKITDVLLSTETTEVQGFLFEGGDDYAEVIYMDKDEEEMKSTGMPGSGIGEAMGGDELLEPRRSARPRKLYEEEEFDFEEEEFDDEEEMHSDEENGY
ncbi:hypothetical protein ACQJBY_066390 [Aegilops geniculata]